MTQLTLKSLFLQMLGRLIDEGLLDAAPRTYPLRTPRCIADAPPATAHAALKVVEMLDRQRAFYFSFRLFHIIHPTRALSHGR